MSETGHPTIRRVRRGPAGPASPPPRIPKRLLDYLDRSGNCRHPDPEQRAKRAGDYKKGWEVRIVVRDLRELCEVRDLLASSGFHVCRFYAKGRQWVQPVYGRAAVERLERRGDRGTGRGGATRGS